jgi:DNA-binding LytR/AlgR family response regulator
MKLLKMIWQAFSLVCVGLVLMAGMILLLQGKDPQIRHGVQDFRTWARQMFSAETPDFSTASLLPNAIGPSFFSGTNGKKVRIPTSGPNNEYLVDPSEIVQIRMEGEKARVYLHGKPDFSSKESLTTLAGWLHEFGYFYQTKQHIINLRHIEEIVSEPNQFGKYQIVLKMQGAENIPIPYEKRKHFQEELDRWLANPRSAEARDRNGY